MMRPTEKAFNFLIYICPRLKLKLLLIIIINTQTVFGQNNFNENTTFHEVVKQAQIEGYTEPVMKDI